MFEELLEDVSKPTRVAIACACVEHVVETYKKANFSYKAGAASRALGAEPDADLVDAALELAWRFAERGKAVDPKAIKAFKQQTSALPSGMTLETMALPAQTMIEAVEHMLLATQDDTSEAAAAAMSTCEDVLSDMIETLPDYDEKAPDKACDEEIAWQGEVLERAQGAKPPLGRAVFADLIARKMGWQQFVEPYASSL
jgi:hypothetical protein